jgi:hypothetical protein
MRAWRSSAALQLAAVASVSVLIGHWLAYMAAVPHAGLRDELLLTSGHGYWLLAVKASLVLGAAALAGAAVDAVRRRRAGGVPAWSARSALFSLVVVQLCAFSLLEAGERILAGEPWQTMLHHDVYAWGLLAQLLIAPLGAAFLALLARALRAVADLPARLAVRVSPGRATLVALPGVADYVAPRDWRGAFSTRGPPA